MHYMLRAEAGDQIDRWLQAFEGFVYAGAPGPSSPAVSLILRHDPHADCFLFDWPETSEAVLARAQASLPGPVQLYQHESLEPELELTRLAAQARRVLTTHFEDESRKEAFFRELVHPALNGLGDTLWSAMQFHLNCALSTAHSMDEGLANRLGESMRDVLESYVGGTMEV